MDVVTVSKEALLDTLRTNREKHVGTFQQVLEDYRLQAVRLLEEHIARIENGAVEKVYVSLPPPQNYEAEYDRAIAMVEWEQRETIELDAHTFNQWVMDEWAWKNAFNETVATYSLR